MIRYLFVDFLLPVLLFFLLRAALRNLFCGKPLPHPPALRRIHLLLPVQPGGELKKDPVCGTYVSTAASVTRTVGGQVVHFCSKECRDKYRG